MLMDSNRYSISKLTADLRAICAEFSDEKNIIGHVRPLARRAALSKNDWLEKRFFQTNPDQGFGVYLLHEEPDHSLAVFAVSWLPARGTPPHDHGTWAVIAGVDGPEKNEFWERTDDGRTAGYAELKKVGEKVCGVGEVLAMPRGTIHSAWNETDAITVSLHIYGRHISHTGRSQYDLEKRTETPYILKIDN